jgi:hypothetical protein
VIIINDFAIDAAITEDHTFESEVTEHPVETGADITDHARAKPVQISLEGIVSNTPIGAVADLRTEGTLPSAEARALMRKIRDDREPITIVSTVRVYKNMMLLSLSESRSAETGEAYRFRATFKEVIFVTNARTTVRVSTPRAKKKVNRGHQIEIGEAVIEETAPKAPAEKRKSLAKRAVNFLERL